uniref:NADH dehydrogenase [ubiquinone] 1 alpha subcomplex subunit 2 n=1 Tax=Monodon monoceros TaxID=40151 RepID=A0A8C6AJN7_MONMO
MPALARKPGSQVRHGPVRRAGFGTPGSRPRRPGCLRRPAPTPHARCSLRPCRDFIEKRYVELKKANPDLPILIRECSDVQPKLWARYAFGQEKNVSLNNFSADQVTRALENVLRGKA